MNAETYKKIFAPDRGSLLEITIFGTTIYDWKLTLDFLSANYSLFFSENGTQMPLPDVQAICNKTEEASFLIEVMLPGFTVNCHAIDEDQIQFDLLPEDVNSGEKAEEVFRLMARLAKLLQKDVLLTPEFGSATQEELKRLAVCKIDAGGRMVSRLD
jgi:hypothetical protein